MLGGATKPAAEPVENKPSPTVAAARPQTQVQRAFATMEEFERAMCACTTAACASQVSDEMTEWGHRESQAQNGEPLPMSEAEQKRAVEIGTHMGECLQKALTAGQP